ncbi:MAG: carbohydrate ABC transporter permease [Chloroflexota bacterium]
MNRVTDTGMRTLLGFRLGWYQRRRVLGGVRLFLSYLLLTALAAVFSLPFYWMVANSLKTEQQLAMVPPEWVPKPVDWRNYYEALTSPTRPFKTALYNTIMYTLVGGFGVVMSSCLVAYGFARLDFDGKNLLFVLVLSTMMLPSQVTLIPRYILFKTLGWLDSFKPLIVPNYLGSAFYVFLLRQFYMTLPMELDEAAIVDGASRWTIFWRIILPLSTPIMVTVIAFNFINHWNDFFGPLIYLDSTKRYVLSLWLALFRVDPTTLRIDYIMAGSVVMVVPVVLVFLVCQRYFISGITMTGLKG